MLVGGTSAHDADFTLAANYLVVLASFNPLLELSNALKLDLATRLGKCGHHNPLGSILLVGFRGKFNLLASLNGRLRMRNSNRRAHDHGNVKLLRNLVRITRELKGLSRIRRIHNGNMGRHAEVMGVLLVLRGMHSRIISSQKDKTAVDTRVCSSKKGVRSNVDTYMLHRRKNACTSSRSANADLQRHLFVSTPFSIHAFFKSKVLEGFGRRRTGICNADGCTRLPRTLRDSFVT